MAYKCSGRSSLLIKVGLSALFGLCMSVSVQAAPAGSLADAMAQMLEIAEGAWADALLFEDAGLMPYDERIFTELSPLLDSQESVRLPADQLLTD